ncbi:hypothetical protein [Verrucosispora sp. WMMD1129]|uniref:hypothetical protein n=1 Tax=Verrucosispora sp. WMMD1129 TaxID=3016093 RepID=UPI00249CF28F|nr:hypothetical protein [Verrucosispora sp. WMMD1129]WFE45011.1 hypothetical protein O7624_12010 [Verrucosispora sp. WMMD1129]
MPQTRNRPGVASGAASEVTAATTSSVPPTSGVLRPVAGWCPPGGCAARNADRLEQAVVLAFEHGRAYERAELAEMESTWRPLARSTYEQKVAERMAEMDRAARDRAAHDGRPYRLHPGGPVEWETGRPVRGLGVAA